MPVAPDVEEYLFEQLDASEYLIVLCSPGAVESVWVSKEIRHFLETSGRDRMLTVMTDGDPDVILSQLMPNIQPNYLNLIGSTSADIKQNPETLFLPLCAKLIGCRPSELSNRHMKRKMRKMLFWTIGIAAALLALTWTGLQFQEKERELARQREQTKQRESEIIINGAEEQLESGERAAAMEVAVQVLDEEDRPYCATAEKLLISAMDVFHTEQLETMIPAMVLEHVNPVSAFCLSQDESKLFLVDINNYVACYDTVTGRCIWEQKEIQNELLLNHSVFSAPGEHRFQYGDKFITAVGGNLIIHDYNASMIALSQETGAVQWKHDYQNYWSNISISGDQQILCHICYDGEEDVPQQVIEYLDAATGAVLQEIPFPEASNPEKQPYVYSRGDSSAMLSSEALSEDGRYFAIAYVEEYPDGTTYLCCYVADRIEGTCRVISRKKMPVDPSYFTTMVRFTDQDQTVTYFHNKGEASFAGTLEKYRLSDGKRLWSKQTPSEDQKDFRNLYRLLWQEQGENILLGCQDRIWLIDGDNGKTKAALELSAPVLGMFPLADGSFAVVQENGEYFVCYADGSGITKTDLCYTLSPTNQAAVTVLGLSLPDGTEDTGLRFAATVPNRNKNRILLHRLVSMEGRFPSIDTGIIFRDTYINDQHCRYIDEDTMLLGGGLALEPDIQSGGSLEDLFSEYRYALIDAKTNQLREYLNFPWLSWADFQWIPDYKNILYFDANGYLNIYNLESKLFFPFSDGYTIELDENEYFHYLNQNNLVGAKMCPELQTLLVVVCLEERIDAICIQGVQYESDIAEIQWTIQSYPFSSGMTDNTTEERFEVRIGENGIFATPFSRENEEFFSGCAFYDTNTGDSYEYNQMEGFHDIWIGDHSPVAAILTTEDSIDLFDIAKESLHSRIPLSLPYTSVEHVQFLLDDQYLLVQTSTGQLIIYSTTTGDLVYSERDEEMSVISEVYCAEDTIRHRLYIETSSSFGSCIDTRSWTKIAEIPRFAAYNAHSNTIYRWLPYGEMNSMLVACTLPETEELVAIAKSILSN